MSLRVEDSVNIKDLVLAEADRKKYFFDPEMELKTKDWDNLKTSLEEWGNSRNENSLNLFFEGATAAKIVDPTRFRTYFGNIKDYLPKLLKLFDESEDNLDWSNQVDAAYWLKTLFPERPVSFGNQKDLVEYILTSPRIDGNKTWYHYPLELMHLKVVNPDLVPDSFIDDTWWRELNTVARDFIAQDTVITHRGLSAYAALRVLAPERWQSALVDKKIAPKIGDLLAELREQGLAAIFSVGANAKIITAEEVRIGEQGLEIIMPDQSSKMHPGELLPEVRRF